MWTLKNFLSGERVSKAQEAFTITSMVSPKMESWVHECANIYAGNPCWINEEDHIDTINFAKVVCSELAKLTTQSVKITISGSKRADWIQAQFDKIASRLRHWVEYGCAYGTVILKPNGGTVDLYRPDNFVVTGASNGEILGAVFYDSQASLDGKKWYTRLEYHRFENGQYRITNKCYVGYTPGDISRDIHISLTPWADLAEDVTIDNLKAPLFAVFRTPQANNIDIDSPLGLPVFSEAVQELQALDVAWSRNYKEIIDSKRTVLLDSDRLLTGKEAFRNPHALGNGIMPDYIKLVDGDTSVESDIYHEINPQLNTDTRLKGINALLNQIGFKSGFSNGHYVFDEATGIRSVQTATQVEADQQRTIQTIADIRVQLERCLRSLVYALNAFADLYELAPSGTFDLDDAIHFEDITYSFEEDRLHHYQLAVQGHYPWEEYYVRYLKCSREEAKELLKMAKSENKAPTLFESWSE